MWSMVAARCSSLGTPLPGDMFVSVGGCAAPAPATATATATAVSSPSDAGPAVARVNIAVANE